MKTKRFEYYQGTSSIIDTKTEEDITDNCVDVLNKLNNTVKNLQEENRNLRQLSKLTLSVKDIEMRLRNKICEEIRQELDIEDKDTAENYTFDGAFINSVLDDIKRRY